MRYSMLERRPRGRRARRLRGRASTTPRLTELSERILDALVDEHELHAERPDAALPAAQAAGRPGGRELAVAFDAERRQELRELFVEFAADAGRQRTRGRAHRGPPRPGRVPGPPLLQPRRAPRRPRPGGVGRPAQGGRPLRPRAGPWSSRPTRPTRSSASSSATSATRAGPCGRPAACRSCTCGWARSSRP